MLRGIIRYVSDYMFQNKYDMWTKILFSPRFISHLISKHYAWLQRLYPATATNFLDRDLGFEILCANKVRAKNCSTSSKLSWFLTGLRCMRTFDVCCGIWDAYFFAFWGRMRLLHPFTHRKHLKFYQRIAQASASHLRALIRLWLASRCPEPTRGEKKTICNCSRMVMEITKKDCLSKCWFVSPWLEIRLDKTESSDHISGHKFNASSRFAWSPTNADRIWPTGHRLAWAKPSSM